MLYSRITLLCLFISASLCPAAVQGQQPPPDDAITSALAAHQYDLDGNGRDFLLKEARSNDFFLFGELHGENEVPALLRALWPAMWKDGYRHVAAELSPWAADQLELAAKGPDIQTLWTRRQARDIHTPAGTGAAVLWGCDMEEVQPQYLVRELAALNPSDVNLARMTEQTKSGYDRKMAAGLLALARASKASKDKLVNGVSLRGNLLATLEIDANRAGADTKMTAQNERELLMKRQFLNHFNQAAKRGDPGKVLMRFGRNHLHRGYDARGISTLGNFIAEFAIARGQKAFNVGAFAAGGKETLMGETFDADERGDELTFALLTDKARAPATVFDLRPLRPLLHRIPAEKRTPLEANLVYWSDAYDALICWRTVTPLGPAE
jgi:hypothetical protein